jgi:hypothetical protein
LFEKEKQSFCCGETRTPNKTSDQKTLNNAGVSIPLVIYYEEYTV